MAIWTWGSDIYGRLGHGTEDKHLDSPAEVKRLSGATLKAITCGSAHNIVVDESGQCFTWGKCHFGQLGHGEADKDEHVPRLVTALKSVVIQSVGAGDSHVLAVSDSGQVYSWGVGFYGCLGHGDETSLSVPKLIDTLSGAFIVSASAGAYHSLAKDKEGSVFVWGRDNHGQLGQPMKQIPGLAKPLRVNQKVPIYYQYIPKERSCRMISACNNHSLMLMDSGTIISLGYNDNGELGRPNDADKSVINPSCFIGYNGQVEPVKLISAGWKHCAAITESGCLFTWGHGAYGRLGQGHTRDESYPRPVETSGKHTPFKDVSCGESHTVALDMEGVVWVCGSAHYGKLGLSVDQSNSVTTLQPLPFKFGEISGVLCGTNHSVAYKLSA